MDQEAIKACLATHARERAGFTLGGTEDPRCGVPPFDASGVPVELWAWPWTEWPLLNDSAFERDRDRIERWYRARGYYDAHVVDALIARDEAEREAEISIEVSEGEPVLIVRIDLVGLDSLPDEVKEEAHAAVELELGEPFDEAIYDRSKRALLDALYDASYARAKVEGAVSVDPETKIARVTLRVEPGAPCHFGDVLIEGYEDLSKRSIRLASGISRDDPYSLSAMRDAERAIFALGPFASVDVEPHVRPDSPVVDVLIRVVPGRRFRFGIGAGMEAGNAFAQEAEGGVNSYAQWDVHLLGRLEHRNFLGGMRRLRIEERPRWIFDNKFPGTSPNDQPGNLLITELRQPAFLEARTALLAYARWDRGPDPFGGRFLRHDVVASVGPERYFLGGNLRWSTLLAADFVLPDKEQPYPNTKVVYLNHNVRLDLRDDARNTREGLYFSLGVQHSGVLLPADWTYLRVIEDNRGYVPIFGDIVLAGRVRLGWMEVFSSKFDGRAEAESDPLQAQFLENLADFGPLRQRLRGGGHNSVRGYDPNTLGDAQILNGRLLSGGLRQWEASVELRVPLTASIGTVLFVDAGDVSRDPVFRFDRPQTSFGLGLRYKTIVGPLRFDVAMAPPGLQVIGEDDRIRTGIPRSTAFGFDGALHFTIGEAY